MGILTVGAASGAVTGLTAGTSVVTYEFSANCRATKQMTVNPSPSPITGATDICLGGTSTLNNPTPGGAWGTANASVATINSSGVVTGVGNGTTDISYSLPSGCFNTTTATVNTVSEITGDSTICGAETITVSALSSGGTWSATGSVTISPLSANTAAVSGTGMGVATTSYTAASGCISIFTATAIPAPIAAPITGSLSICEGSIATLNNATSGGEWSSANASVATISASGVITGITNGTAIISYTVTNSCGAAIATAQVTINAMPNTGSIIGITTVCEGVTTTLGNIISGGEWSSANTTVATIDATGIVTGVAAGTATISYTVTNDCGTRATTIEITVNPLPDAGYITGMPSMCEGVAATLNNIVSGGNWSSANTGVATVSASGVATGIAAGNTTISYTVTNGCGSTTATKDVTVNEQPSPISGILNACVGSSTTLSNSISGGTWASNATSIATIDPLTGIAFGITPGTARVTYTIGASCVATDILTVNPLPNAITGMATFCIGVSSPLHNTTPGGIWSSSDAAIAAVGSSSGIASGISGGSAIISYTLSTGCSRAIPVNVSSDAGTVTGITGVCAGAITTLSSSVTGGVYSSGNTAIATVGATSGVVSGIATGTATITYSIGGSCRTTTVVTVKAQPSNISGATRACIGTTTTLTNSTPGGTWSSANESVHTVGVNTGIVTGVSAGTAMITYATGVGCYKAINVTINPTPAPITGTASVCQGATTTLSNATTPLVSWVSSNTSVATINSVGAVSGVSAGTATITYTAGTSCSTTRVVTVNPLPSVISGVLKACPGNVTTLGNTIMGGTWSNNNTAIATIGPSSGIVSGIAAGTSVITYTLGTGCRRLAIATINALPSISGTAKTCVGTTTALSSAGGGTWSSSNLTVATVGSTGIVKGISTGTANITYTLSTGCTSTRQVTISPSPTAITGTNNVCIALTTTLSNTVGGGTWSSSNTAMASINGTTGVVTGLVAGNVTISYSIGTSCKVTMPFTVKSSQAVTGTNNACKGQATKLANGVGGGTWSSSNSGVAPVSTTGLVTGLSAGSANISYTAPNGCARWLPVTIYAVPGSFTGSSTVCTGATATLSNAVPGGYWYSSTPVSRFTVDSTSGVVSGVTVGTGTITYAFSANCKATKPITVNASPSPITGTTNVCLGSSSTLTNSTPGGTWNTTNPAVATVNSSGAINSIALGIAPISYSLANGCFKTAVVTVSLGAQITGDSTVCGSSPITMGSLTTGGTWASTGAATISPLGASNAIVSGTGPGIATVSYTAVTGCISTHSVTVNLNPDAIAGTGVLCTGTTATLSNATTGGIWLSTNSSVAAINSSGVISGLSTGTTTISYTVASSCGIMFAAKEVTINTVPDVSTISGTGSVCPGDTTTLGASSDGGSWSSDNTAIAAVNSTGIVTGIALGATTISYTASNSCGSVTALKTVTVNAATPTVSPITGAGALCAGNTMALSNTTSGGVWSSSNTAQATVGSSGIVTGIAYGNPVISYTISNVCGTAVATAVVNVRVTPAPITGPSYVPVGGSVSLTEPVGGGSWSSDQPTVAQVSSSGVVTGIAPGAPTISYSMANICGANVVTAQVVVAQPGSWLGTNSTDWNDAANWFNNIIPTDTSDVIITLAPFNPIISSGPAYARRFEITPGAVLNIASPAVFNVKGNLVNNGTITGGGTVVLNGSSTQLLSGNGRISNLTVANNAHITTDAEDSVGITGTLLLNSGTLTTNSRLLLVSNSAGTGRIGTITGGAISGNVLAQQYIQGGRRAYRFWGHPFSVDIPLSQLTPFIDVSGMGGWANGFTTTTTNEPSCFWYNPLISNSTVGPDPGWVAFTNTDGVADANKCKPYEGIRLFIRGKKGEGLTGPTGYTPSPVTIQMYGPVNTGTQTVTLAKGTATATDGSPTQDYNVISNPYPSPVDMGTVAKNAYDAGQITGSSFWVWNPYLGANGQFQAIPIDGTPYYIEANSSFEIRAANNGSTLTFTEANKSATYNTTLLKKKPDFLTLKIYDEGYKAWDMVHVKFDGNATDQEDCKYDAKKPLSPADLNFYSVTADKKKMNIDARPYTAGKTIPLGITSRVTQEFIMKADNISIPEGGQVYLYDKYLQQSTLIQLGTEYRFRISEDSLTQGDSRFELRMGPAKATDVVAATNTEITLTPNPAKNDVTLNYTAKNAQEATVTVSNIAGEILITKSLGASKNGKVNIALQNLPAGAYMVTFVSGNEKITQKLIKD
jgi:uncharacterized protein YjdB